nr:immunoglobulin light chain junction region [Macaca mulatta]
CQQYLRAPFIF